MKGSGIALLQYDTDVTTWSPQGRLHQVEYAMEAVKQGSAAVGLKVCVWLYMPQLIVRLTVRARVDLLQVLASGEHASICL